MAKRRANGDGCISRRKDGRYEARYFAADDNRKTLYAKTRKEAVAKLANAMAENEALPATVEDTSDEGHMTIREFFAEYGEVARNKMKPRSLQRWHEVLRLHILPAFGDMPLDGLKREHVQRFYSRLQRAGYSPATVKRIYDALSPPLNAAVEWGYIERNPCKLATRPRVEQPDVRPFSKDEAKRFLKAAESEGQYHALYVLGLTSGARWSELCGLQWRDFDLANRTMRIERTILRNPGGGYSYESPKTRGSRRTVKLTMKAIHALTAHRESLIGMGIPAGGKALVFVNEAGKPVHQSNFIRRSFKPLLKRAGLPQTNWHAATRHTCTCLLLLERVNPKSVAMQMGWSSVSFMLTNYARFLPDWNDGDDLDRILG